MTTVTAIYENGVLRPTERLPFKNGESVQLTVTSTIPTASPINEDEGIRRMKEAKSLTELFAAFESLPPPADGYDLCKALNDNRRATGERLLNPESDGDGK